MLSLSNAVIAYLDANKFPYESDRTGVRSTVEVDRTPAKVTFYEVINPRMGGCTVTVDSIAIPTEKHALVMELMVLMNLNILLGHLGFNPADGSITSRAVMAMEWSSLTINQIGMVLESCTKNLTRLLTNLPMVLDGSMTPAAAAVATGSSKEKE